MDFEFYFKTEILSVPLFFSFVWWAYFKRWISSHHFFCTFILLAPFYIPTFLFFHLILAVSVHISYWTIWCIKIFLRNSKTFLDLWRIKTSIQSRVGVEKSFFLSRMSFVNEPCAKNAQKLHPSIHMMISIVRCTYNKYEGEQAKKG